MRSVVLAQLRRHPARYVATALAIVLGTAFVAAGFLFTSTLRNTLGNALVADVARADVVVGPTSAGGRGSLDAAQVAAVTRTPGVRSSLTVASGDAQVDLPKVGRQSVTTRSVATDPVLLSQHVVSGSSPVGAGQLAIGKSAADATGLGTGAIVTLASGGADGGGGPVRSVRYTISGVLDPRGDLGSFAQGLVFYFPDGHPAGTVGSGAERVALLADDGVDPGQLRADAAQRLAAVPAPADRGPAPRASTVAQYRQASIGEIAVAVQLVGAFVQAFAVLALAVAGLVIANTFVILLTQRTRELALLRCVGAERRQVFRSVVAEAAVLGGVSAVLGVLAAWGISSAAVAVANRFDLPVVIATPVITATAVVIPLVAGLVVTVVAALAPARRATAVAPVAALRQDLGLAVRNRRGLVRLVLGLLLISIGVLGILAGAATSGTTAVLLTALGGALSFIGVLAAARLFVPAVARLLGFLVRVVGGVPGRLAVLNVLRNPARATATCTALVIGVTLVATVGVGAATARSSALSLVLGDNPVDVVVSTGYGSQLQEGTLAANRPAASPALTPGTASRIAAVDGVEATASLVEAPVQLVLPGRRQVSGPVSGADPAALTGVVREDVARSLGPDTVLVGSQLYLDGAPLVDGDRVTVTGARGATRTLTVRPAAGLPVGLLLDQTTLAAVTGTTPVPTTTWSRTSALDATGDIGRVDDTVNGVRSAIGDSPAGSVGGVPDVLQVSGGAQIAAALVTVLDALVKILTALLGVALLIALVGIANTLSLSVLERRRENGLLRALGLGRGALRATIVWEALTLALVAVGLGLGLGLAYAWIGTRTVFSGSTNGTVRTVFTVPVGQTLLLVAVAVAAGLLASVLPARRAARTAPAAVLAED